MDWCCLATRLAVWRSSGARLSVNRDMHRTSELCSPRIPAQSASLLALVALDDCPHWHASPRALRRPLGHVMIRDNYADRHHHPPLIESAEILIAAVIMFSCWFGWYVGRERYYLTTRQLAEFTTYLIIAAFALVSTVGLLATRRSRREKEWPHPPWAISRKRDEKITRQAWNQNSVVLGYDIHGQPWYWPDSVRVMQAIVLGMTGTGKTTLLRNIISQDLARIVGTPDEPHRIPMVIFDGKGDLEFFQDLLPHVHRAGRLHQLRL